MLSFLRPSRPVNKPRLPDGVRVYAFGDIHGRGDLLKDMFTVIDADLSRNPVRRPIEVFLGDYIDRGRYSGATLDLLIERSRRHETVFLKGNHEAYFLEVLKKPQMLAEWRQIGGLQTLMSYGLQPSLNPGAAEQENLIRTLMNIIPEGHLRFLKHLKLSFFVATFSSFMPAFGLGSL
jgi:serine/threonine protein phosphatase 1